MLCCIMLVMMHVGEGSTGKELTQAVCRAAHKLVRQIPPRAVSVPFASAVRQRIPSLAMRVQAAAFNCLILIVAKTQSEEQFFDNFLFKEKSSAADQQFWCNVVDCVSIIDFNSQTTFDTVIIGGPMGNAATAHLTDKSAAIATLPVRGVLSQYMLLSSSRLLSGSNIKRMSSSSQVFSQSQSGEATSALSASQTGNALSGPRGGRYSWKENPLDTFASLSQQVTSSPSSSGAEQGGGDYDLEADGSQMARGQPVIGFDDVKIALERNHVNQQRCMGNLVRVICRMNTLFCGRWAECARHGNVPYWITVCRDKLCDFTALPSTSCLSSSRAAEDQRMNIRLFMLRLLMNQPVAGIVAPFVAQCLLKPIIDCCLHDLCGIRSAVEVAGHSKCHYMIKDVVFTLVDSWPSSLCDADEYGNSFSASTPFATVTESAAAFLSYLIRHVFTDDDSLHSAKVTDNLRALCAVIRLWVAGPPGKNSANLIRDGLDLSPLIELISTDVAASGGAHAKASSRGSISVRKRLAGLEVLNCLQSCGYPLLFAANASQRRWATDILVHVTSGCKYPRKEVSIMSATVAGALLNGIVSSDNYCGKRMVDDASRLAPNVEAKLVSIFLMKNGADSVVWCVNAICRQHPAFLTREMLLKLFGYFGHFSQKARADFLEIICNCTSKILSEFEGIVIMDYLRPYLSTLLNDVSVFTVGRGSSRRSIPLTQILIIRLIKLYAKSVIDREIFSVVVFGSDVADNRVGSNCIVKFIHESSLIELRREAFQALMALHSETSSALSSAGPAVTQFQLKWQLGVLRVLLLRGLTDPDSRGMSTSTHSALTDSDRTVSGIRRDVYTYFEDNFGLSGCPIARMDALLSELYDPIQAALSSDGGVSGSEELLGFRGMNVSDEWLQYCSYLLLGAVRMEDTMGLPRRLFPQGLAPDDAYTPMESLDTVSGSVFSASPMTPLFAIENTQPQLYAGRVYGRGPLRGTQELAWTQTQDGDDRVSQTNAATVNSGSRQTTHHISSQLSDQEKAFFTQFIASPRSDPPSKASSMPPPVGLPSSQDNSSSSTSGGVFITQRVPIRYRTRLSTIDENDTGSQTNSIVSTASFPVYSKKRKIQKMKQDKLKRSAMVTCCRNYRAGELPDICVALADVITPIQALCLRDSMSASVVFNQFFKTVYRVVLDKCSERGVTMRRALASMLGHADLPRNVSIPRPALTSTTLVSSIFAAYRECMSSEHKVLRGMEGYLLSLVDAAKIATAAISSLNFHAGILLLEDQILSRFQSASVDASRGAVVCRDTESNWINLTRLYNHIQEKDIIQGLLFQISQLKDTRDALDAEMRGNYPRAIEILNELIEASENIDQNQSDSFDFDASDSSFATGREIAKCSAQERLLWNERSLECVRQLLDWDQLYEKIDAITLTQDLEQQDVPIYLRIAGHNSPAEPSRASMTWMLPYYVHSLSHVGGMVMVYSPTADGQLSQTVSSNETEKFLEAVLSARDQLDVRGMTSDIATCFLSLGEATRAQAHANGSYLRFLESWSALHPCATSARGNLLAGLQKVVELEDAVELISSTSAVCSPTLEKTLHRWEQARPAPDDPLWVWDDVGRVRSLALMLYSDKYFTDAKDNTAAPKDSIRLINHLSSWCVQVAVAAVGQGVMQVVKNQLAKSNSLRRRLNEPSVGSTSPLLTMEEVITVYQYNKKSINMVLQEGYSSDRDFQDTCYDKIVSMYEKTSTLLNMKIDRCRATSSDDQGSLLATMTLRGEWYSSWATFVRLYRSSDQSWPDMANTALEALCYVANQPEGYPARGVDISGMVYGKLVRHCDDMLEILATEEYARGPPHSGLSFSKENLAQVSMDAYVSGLQAGDAICK